MGGLADEGVCVPMGCHGTQHLVTSVPVWGVGLTREPNRNINIGYFVLEQKRIKHSLNFDNVYLKFSSRGPRELHVSYMLTEVNKASTKLGSKIKFPRF